MTNPDCPLTKEAKEMITAGIDCGARNTKTVILKDEEIYA
jgi:activator of 2-hydroxyglutaryl-CoA dehydratase